MKFPLWLIASSLPLVLIGGVTGIYGLKALAVLFFVTGAFWFVGHAIASAREEDDL